jgi:hypothetical protein
VAHKVRKNSNEGIEGEIVFPVILPRITGNADFSLLFLWSGTKIFLFNVVYYTFLSNALLFNIFGPCRHDGPPLGACLLPHLALPY